MGTYTRPAKPVSGDGGGSYVDGNKLPASELNADMDDLVTIFNGSIDKDNISSSAEIPNSSLLQIDDTKVDDSSVNEAAMLVTASPGDSGTFLLATDLKGELERLRYRIGANNANSLNLKFKDTTGSTVAAGWFEPPRVGRNLLKNSGFEVHSAGSPNAPDGWSLELTPTAVTLEAAADPEAGVDKRSLRILADAGNVGISQIVTGLKSSTKYLVGMAYTLTAGDINLVTVNGLGSGDYQDLSLNDGSNTSSGIEILQGIVKTDSTPTDITVQILSTSNLDDFNLYYVWFYEMSDDAPIEAPHIPMQSKVVAVEAIYPAVPTTPAGGVIDWEEITELRIGQYVPYEGYRFIYEATVNWMWSETRGNGVAGPTDSEFTHAHHGIRLNLDTGGGDSVVEGPHLIFTTGLNAANEMADGQIATLRYVVENPTPGLTYTFSVDMGVAATNSNYAWAIVNPLHDTQQGRSTSRLYTERI